ncbi:hypothetical protein HID58_019366 [Brassica napus]|nr:hypothetical protein HID58_019366 [Brassica napus]CAF2101018.1 unnamed protein product [Brassica napus]CAG7877990.1 unnamed protein product [Brassica rapa]VDC72981.1 unnamed protein product [Brassica rapa]
MSSINPKQSIMQTLEAMPEDMRLLIVSKVGQNSHVDYFNTVLTCRSLSFRPDNPSVAKDLNLSPFVKKPLLSNQYESLMDACLKADNTDAHFVKGMIQFFQSQNQVLGLHHIHIASKSGHLQGRYIFGVLLMAIGETDKGIKIINNLTEEKELNCHPGDGTANTVCSKCFHFFLLTDFYTMMMGFNNLLD